MKRLKRKKHAADSKPKKPRDSQPSRYRAVLREVLVVPESPQEKAVILSAGAVVELMDMRTFFRDRVSPITRNADELLIRYGQRGKEQLGWLAKGTPLKPVKGPLFFVKTADHAALAPWDRVRFFVARADHKQTHGQRWWIAPWLIANVAMFDVEVKKAIRELGGRVDKEGDPDIHAAHLYRLVTGQELEMKAKDTKELKKANKANKNAKNAKAEKVAKKASKKADKQPTRKGGYPAVVSQKNAKQYDRDRGFDTFTIKRLTKENPHRPGSTQAKRWSILKKGMSVAEYVSKGGSRGTLSQWISTGAAKIVRAGGSDAGAE